MGRGILSLKTTAIGTSVRGAPIEIFEPTSATSDILVMAGQHGEETETVILLSKALRLIQADLAVHVLLCANPDGAQLGTRGNSRGVDLNRNFPAQNWQSDPVHHCWSLQSSQNIPLSPGPHPGSEPETRALQSYIEQTRIRTIVSLHAPLACIDDPESTALAGWLANKTGLPLVGSVGYPTRGSLGSWGADNGIQVITYELPPESVWHLQDVHLPVLQDLLQGAAPRGV